MSPGQISEKTLNLPHTSVYNLQSESFVKAFLLFNTIFSSFTRCTGLELVLHQTDFGKARLFLQFVSYLVELWLFNQQIVSEGGHQVCGFLQQKLKSSFWLFTVDRDPVGLMHEFYHTSYDFLFKSHFRWLHSHSLPYQVNKISNNSINNNNNNNIGQSIFFLHSA